MKHTFFITLATSAVALSALVASVPAHASGLSPVQVQSIMGLLKSFGADESVITNVQSSLDGTASATASTPSSSSSNACVVLSSNLTFGSKDSTTGGQVSKLQAFLGGTVNGNFGPATQKLVQNWQTSHGVVSSGSPSTTGFGAVGAKTRAAMACGSQSSSAQSGAGVSGHLPPVTTFEPRGMFAPPQPTPAPTTQPQPAPAPSAPAAANATTMNNVTAAINRISSASASTQTNISGTAQGTNSVTVSVSKLGQKIYDSAPLSTSGGVWSVTIPASALTSGTYAVTVYDGSSTRVIARGSMTIVAPGY